MSGVRSTRRCSIIAIRRRIRSLPPGHSVVTIFWSPSPAWKASYGATSFPEYTPRRESVPPGRIAGVCVQRDGGPHLTRDRESAFIRIDADDERRPVQPRPERGAQPDWSLGKDGDAVADS